MDAHQSHGSRFPSQPKPDLELFFAVPAVHDEGMTEEDWNAEIKRMFQHSVVTRQFIDGKISPQDYEDALADLGHDPTLLEDRWAESYSLGL